MRIKHKSRNGIKSKHDFETVLNNILPEFILFPKVKGVFMCIYAKQDPDLTNESVLKSDFFQNYLEVVKTFGCNFSLFADMKRFQAQVDFESKSQSVFDKRTADSSAVQYFQVNICIFVYE